MITLVAVKYVGSTSIKLKVKAETEEVALRLLNDMDNLFREKVESWRTKDWPLPATVGPRP